MLDIREGRPGEILFECSSRPCSEVSHCTNSPQQDRCGRRACTLSPRFAGHNPASVSNCRRVSLLIAIPSSSLRYSAARRWPEIAILGFHQLEDLGLPSLPQNVEGDPASQTMPLEAVNK